jgi:7-cyano-7-deazaguanine synthase
VLLVDLATRGEVQPIYVSVGLAWERAEQHAIAALTTERHDGARIRPLAELAVDMTDVYPHTHWAVTGRPPAYHTADEEVYIPGRNIVLLGKAAVFCAAAGIGRVAIGTLDHNPFPDATPAFRDAMANALSMGLGHALTIDAPYSASSKADVIRRGVELGVPLALTLSCMNPPIRERDSVVETAPHCGQCSKCRERHDAFVDAEVDDPTDYVTTANLAPAR